MHPTDPSTTSDTQPTALASADLLRLAADYLTKYGWTQFDYYAPSDGLFPSACALGALAMVCYGQPIADPFDDGIDDGEKTPDPQHLDCWHDFVTAHRLLIAYLNRNSGCIGFPVDDWNDTPGFTAPKIIATLRAAANHDTQTPLGQVQP